MYISREIGKFQKEYATHRERLKAQGVRATESDAREYAKAFAESHFLQLDEAVMLMKKEIGVMTARKLIEQRTPVRRKKESAWKL